jgi:hypothetical protein
MQQVEIWSSSCTQQNLLNVCFSIPHKHSQNYANMCLPSYHLVYSAYGPMSDNNLNHQQYFVHISEEQLIQDKVQKHSKNHSFQKHKLHLQTQPIFMPVKYNIQLRRPIIP